MPAAKAGSFHTAAKAAGVAVSEIGEVKAGEGTRFLTADGHPLTFKRPSFTHF